jgi:hypothetical protein
MSKKLQRIEDGTALISRALPNYWMTAERFTSSDYEMMQDDNGVWYEEEFIIDEYVLRIGVVGFPPHFVKTFNTLEDLRAEMGDLRHWVVNQYDS